MLDSGSSKTKMNMIKGLRAGPTNRADKLTRGQHTGSNKTGTTNEKES
jgi:hypothetical protein